MNAAVHILFLVLIAVPAMFSRIAYNAAWEAFKLNQVHKTDKYMVVSITLAICAFAALVLYILTSYLWYYGA